MNIHPFDVTRSAPNRGLLHPHPIVPSIEVDAEVMESASSCEILDCGHSATYLLSIHQAHSRHVSEQVGVCHQHLTEHRDGVVLWLTRPYR